MMSTAKKMSIPKLRKGSDHLPPVNLMPSCVTSTKVSIIQPTGRVNFGTER